MFHSEIKAFKLLVLEMSKVMKNVILILFSLFVTNLYSDWNIEVIHERPSDYEHYYKYYYVKGEDAIHFTGYNPGPMRAYRLDLKTLKVTDSIPLRESMEAGYIIKETLVYSDGKVYIQKYINRDTSAIFRIDANNYDIVEDIHPQVKESILQIGGEDNVFLILYSIELNGKEYIVYKENINNNIYFTHNNSDFEQDIVFGNSNMGGQLYAIGFPKSFNDTLVYTSTNKSNGNKNYWVLVRKSSDSEYYNEVIYEEYDVVNNGYKYVFSDRYIYLYKPSSGSSYSRVVQYDPFEGKSLGTVEYPNGNSTFTGSGDSDYIISLFDGRIYDSSVSTSKPIIELDTSMIWPREVEKLGEGDYLVFGTKGIFRITSTTSVDIELKTKPQLYSSIYDLTGRLIYIGNDAETKLRTLTRGTYILMSNGKGELRRVE